MSKITKFEYQGTPISFEFSDGNKMINTTEMAKPLKELIGGFLRDAKSRFAYSTP